MVREINGSLCSLRERLMVKLVFTENESPLIEIFFFISRVSAVGMDLYHMRGFVKFFEMGLLLFHVFSLKFP